MKKFIVHVLISTVVLFSACKSKEKKIDETTSDTSHLINADISTEGLPPALAPNGPSSMLVVRHKVSNFAKWHPMFEAHDSARLASGLHSFMIGRSVDDSNSVMIAMVMDDVNKAKAMVSSPDLKDIMKKAGVVGKPEISFVNAIRHDTITITAPYRLMVKHKVKDFDAWKNIFETDESNRRNAGIAFRSLGRSFDDPNEITIVFAVNDLDKAKAFASSASLKARMDSAGVVGKPDFFYYTVSKRYQ